MTRFVLAALLIVTTALVGSNVATAASSPSQPQNPTERASISLPDFDLSQFRHADNSSRAEQSVPLYLAQASNVCQTPAGWCYVSFAPSGTSCWCNIYGYVYWGYVR